MTDAALAPVPFQRDHVEIGPVEKASIILAALGPSGSAGLLEGMEERRIRAFARTVARLRHVDPATVERVIAEFLELIEADEGVEGGPEATRRHLAAFLEGGKLESIMREVGDDEAESVWDGLAELRDAMLAGWLQTEHPQVAAITLSRLPSPKTARVLEALPADAAQEIVLRMRQAAAAPQEMVDRIGDVIASDFLPIARMKARSADPAELIAAVLNHVSGEVRESVLGRMAADDPALESGVRRVMFTYEDIPARLAEKDIGQVLKAIDEAVLLAALKHGEQGAKAVGEFLLGGVTKRLAERMRGDLAELEPPSKKDGEAAQAELVGAIAALRDSGALKLIDPG